jgi:hypothetical protein
MKFRGGRQNPNWTGGRHVTARGYVRLKTKVGRGKYEHRFVMENLLRDPIGLLFIGGGEIPDGMHVHHCDHNRRHNCEGNLMLLDSAIHNWISLAHRRYLLDHWDEYLRKIEAENTPAWVKEQTA